MSVIKVKEIRTLTLGNKQVQKVFLQSKVDFSGKSAGAVTFSDNSSTLFSGENVQAALDSTNTSIAPRLVPAGGTTDQVLTKTSNADYAAGWSDAGGGGAQPLIEFDISSAPAAFFDFPDFMTAGKMYHVIVKDLITDTASGSLQLLALNFINSAGGIIGFNNFSLSARASDSSTPKNNIRTSRPKFEFINTRPNEAGAGLTLNISNFTGFKKSIWGTAISLWGGDVYRETIVGYTQATETTDVTGIRIGGFGTANFISGTIQIFEGSSPYV